MATTYNPPYDRRNAAACGQPKIGYTGDSWSSKRDKYFKCSSSEEKKPRDCIGGKVNGSLPTSSVLPHRDVACSVDNKGTIKTEKSFTQLWMMLTYEAVNCNETKVRGSKVTMNDSCTIKGIGDDNKTSDATCGNPLLTCY